MFLGEFPTFIPSLIYWSLFPNLSVPLHSFTFSQPNSLIQGMQQWCILPGLGTLWKMCASLHDLTLTSCRLEKLAPYLWEKVSCLWTNQDVTSLPLGTRLNTFLGNNFLLDKSWAQQSHFMLSLVMQFVLLKLSAPSGWGLIIRAPVSFTQCKVPGFSLTGPLSVPCLSLTSIRFKIPSLPNYTFFIILLYSPPH